MTLFSTGEDPIDHSADIAFVLSNSIENFTLAPAFPIDRLPVNDSSQLLNITNFKFLISPPCSDDSYIIVVHSAPENYQRRHLIRTTWGSWLPLYFFFGETTAHQTLLDTEYAAYHDIVQGNFIDSYRNLTYKHTLVFKWVVYNCPHVRYVLKIDDDVFVNIAKLDKFLTQTLSPYGTRDLLMCSYVWHHSAAERSNTSKWRVSVEEYPHEDYPNYCEGAAVVYSPDVLFKLYQMLQQDEKYFWIDDVFVTGIVFSQLNLRHAEFSWWRGHSILKANENDDDYLQYDPSRNLFVLIAAANYQHNRKKLVDYFLKMSTLETQLRR
ncbi:hypothetical protein WDU94_007393 [Cyamophila willieti]